MTLIDDDGTSTPSRKRPTTAQPRLGDLRGAVISSNANVGELVYSYTKGKLTSIAAMDGSTTIATLSLNWGGSGCSALLCVPGPTG